MHAQRQGLHRYVKLVARTGKSLLEAGCLSVRDQWLGDRFPPWPTVLQFAANDICNSRCVMCNIWRQKRGAEITAAELEQILGDPLFAQVRYVGISGGEPTLRPDLADLGRACVSSLPRLSGMGVITNALRPEMALERILGLADVARSARIRFYVTVSLDGIGADHDRNRGVTGNFAAAQQVIGHLRQRGLPVSIGCTLTPLNCYGADDVLLWCEQQRLAWEFRLGVDIKRVYNEGYEREHPFSPEQRFHLVMFFDKLARHPAVGLTHQIFYRSLADQLAFATPRAAGCNWRYRGVTLDCRGNLSYCSVQSPILGCGLTESALSIFRAGLPERRRILRDHCAHCLHDLVGPPAPRAVLRHNIGPIISPWQNRLARLRGPTRLSAPVAKAVHPAARPSPAGWRHVLITGWYGTETTGDKAILGELLHFLADHAPGCRITLTTLDRKVSEQTNREFSMDDRVALVDLNQGADPGLIESTDAVIMGGGPLEEIAYTEQIWRMFTEANRQHKARVIFGCGVGPLYSRRLRRMVGAICQLSTAGFVRDEQSLLLANELGAEGKLRVACDPALAFVRRWALARPAAGQDTAHAVVGGLLRANTREYMAHLNQNELDRANGAAARQLAHIFSTVQQSAGVRIRLLPMSAIPVGGDDRLFNRAVARWMADPETVEVERAYLDLDATLCAIRNLDVAVAMRYHGHLFSMALGVPFLSVDYTGKSGKVASLVSRLGLEPFTMDWQRIDAEGTPPRLDRLLAERCHWSSYLQAQTSKLVENLNQTYTRVFGVPERSVGQTAGVRQTAKVGTGT